MAILLFLIPSKSRPGERLMEWRMARDVPWEMLLLFGGGFALAAGFRASGGFHSDSADSSRRSRGCPPSS